MKYALALLVLMTAQPAFAECHPSKNLIRALLIGQFTPVGEFEHEHKPTVIFVNPFREYIVVQYENEKTLCVIGGGRAFYLFREYEV